MNSNKLIAELHTGKISREEFVARYFGTHNLTQQDKISFLLQEFSAADSIRLEQGLTALFITGIHSTAFSTVLCDLLNNESHFAHENIALYLEELKDPATVSCLSSAIKHRFTYLEYDDSYDLAKTCIRALVGIATPEAIASLRFLSGGTDEDEDSRENVLASYIRRELSLDAL